MTLAFTKSIVAFEDETKQISSEYHNATIQAPVSEKQKYGQQQNPPLSPSVTDAFPTPLNSSDSSSAIGDILQDMLPFNELSAGSPVGSTAGLNDKPCCHALLIGEPKLKDYNEALLLRHFGDVLGPWVCNFFSAAIDGTC